MIGDFWKKVVAVLLMLCLCMNVFALDMTKAEPYEKDEFPKWALDIRRSEVIFLGSLPVTYPVTSLVLSMAKKDLGFWKTMGIAAGVSASIAVTDFVIGLIRK